MPLMRLPDLPVGSSVAIDTNIFVYAATGRSADCRTFLERLNRLELRGLTTLEIMAETCHRLMLDEAFSNGSISRAAAPELRRNHAVIGTLNIYWAHMARLLNLNIIRVALDEFRFHQAQPLRQQHQLLTNDSLLAAAAFQYGIANVATNDSDFERVPWLTVYKPGDIP